MYGPEASASPTATDLSRITFQGALDQLSSLVPAPEPDAAAAASMGVFVRTLIDKLLGWPSSNDLVQNMTLWGRIIDANSFAVEKPRGRHCITRSHHVATALYGPASYVNHACRPNVAFAIRGRANVMTALRDIAPGEELTICYYGGPGGSPSRQSYLVSTTT